jgi:hypothetical protein
MNQRITFAALIVGVFSLTACSMHRFSGNGTLVDRGYWSLTPRYKVSLKPEITLRDDGDYSYQFSGMPRESLSLEFLVIPFATEPDIRATVASLEVDLRGEAGKPVCSFRQTLADIKVNQVLNEGVGAVGGRALWDRACLDIRFDPKLSYQLMAKVSGIPPGQTATYRLVPQFSGGGHELP